MRRRLNSLQVKLRDPLNMFEDSRQLSPEHVDLGIVNLQPSEAGDMENIRAINHGRRS
jgi:hypothetical protein